LARQTTLDEFMYVCPWCGKAFKNRSGYSSHISTCKFAPNGVKEVRELRRELSKLEVERIGLETALRRIEEIEARQIPAYIS